MNSSILEDLPFEIFEIICSYLHPFDIGKLEQTSRNILTSIQELNVWKKVAVTLLQHSEVPAVQDVVKYMKIHEVTSLKFYKIIVGVTVFTMEIMDDFRGSMNDNEAITYIRNYVSPRPSDIGVLHLDEENIDDDESLDDYGSSDEVEDHDVEADEVEDNEVEDNEVENKEVEDKEVEDNEVEDNEVVVNEVEADAIEVNEFEADEGNNDEREVYDGEVVEDEVVNARVIRYEVLLICKKTQVRCLLGAYNRALKTILRNEVDKLSFDVMNDIIKYKSEVQTYVIDIYDSTTRKLIKDSC